MRSWNPAQLLWAQEGQEGRLGLGESRWRVLCMGALTFLTLASLSLSHEAPLLCVWSGPSLEVSLQILLPKTIFCQTICPEAHCNLLSFQDGANKQVETFPCATEGQGLMFPSVFTWFHMQRLEFCPPSKQPLPVPLEGNALQHRAAPWTQTFTHAQRTDCPAGTGQGHPLVLSAPVLRLQVAPPSNVADPSSNRSK